MRVATVGIASVCALGFFISPVLAANAAVKPLTFPALSLSTTPAVLAQAPAPAPGEEPPPTEVRSTGQHRKLYRGVNEFFNIREAYSDVECGEWEIGAGAWWDTGDRRRDHVEIAEWVKLGITDNLHIAVKNSQPLGYGGDGAGETFLRVFNTFIREQDGEWWPAFAGYLDMRIPTGHESDGVDGRMGGILTKQLNDCLRIHFEGWVATVNGVQGYRDYYGTYDYRHFQWGLGPGIDYAIGEDTLIVANYLHQVNPRYGDNNVNTVEAGIVHRFGETENCYHLLKAGCDLNLCDDAPYRFGAKFAWEMYIK